MSAKIAVMETLILPSNPVGKGIDPAFAEYASMLKASDKTVGTVDHDELVNHSRPIIKLPAFAEGPVEYRGWMLTPEQYSLLDEAMNRRSTPLATNAEQFQKAHTLSGWLEEFKDLTFKTAVLRHVEITQQSVAQLTAGFGDKFFVKDFVKSRKDDPSLSIANSPDELWSTIQRFMEAQGEWLVGGIVVREFVPLDPSRVEVRGWWKNGEWKAVTNHPDYSGSSTPLVPDALLSDVSNRLSNMGLRFASADFTTTAVGDWVLIEIGDGQVSGFPDDITEEQVATILGG